MARNYRNDAAAMVDPQFNSKLQQAKAALDSNLQGLEASKTGVNQNYDKAVENNTFQNRLTKNNYSNTDLGRGLARSTIATGDLGSIDLKNTREVGNINAERTGTLNNIDQQKTLLGQNYNNEVQAINADREVGINSLAEQLRQRAEDVAFRNREQAISEANAAASRNFAEKQFNAEQAWKQKAYDAQTASANQIDPYSDKSKNAMEAQYYTLRDSNPQMANKFLSDNKKDIISRYGADTFNTLMEDQKNYEKDLNQKAWDSKGFFQKALTLLGLG